MSEVLAPFFDAGQWLLDLAVDGPDLTVNAHKKAAHEANELADHPNLEELADVAICLIGTALHHGWTFKQVAQAVSDKIDINRQRTWHQEPDGTWQHT